MITFDTGYSIPIPLSPGDLVLFGGHTFISKAIRLITDPKNHAISHCGVIIAPTTIVESTSLDGHKGVGISHLEEWLYKYPGEVYVKYLTKESREKLDSKRLVDFLVGQDGDPYNTIQAFFSMFHMDMPKSWGKESWYCSELAIAAYKQGNLVPVNFLDGITPFALGKLPIFEKQAWQLKGNPKELK